jgi:hypothetical protein
MLETWSVTSRCCLFVMDESPVTAKTPGGTHRHPSHEAEDRRPLPRPSTSKDMCSRESERSNHFWRAQSRKLSSHEPVYCIVPSCCEVTRRSGVLHMVFRAPGSLGSLYSTPFYPLSFCHRPAQDWNDQGPAAGSLNALRQPSRLHGRGSHALPSDEYKIDPTLPESGKLYSPSRHRGGPASQA